MILQTIKSLEEYINKGVGHEELLQKLKNV